jgi:putative transposase
MGVWADDRIGPDRRADRGSAPTIDANVAGQGRDGGEIAAVERPALPQIVQWFKSLTTARYRHGVRDQGWPSFPGRVWQRNYYEHIIRNEQSLDKIRAYIHGNPAAWMWD